MHGFPGGQAPFFGWTAASLGSETDRPFQFSKNLQPSSWMCLLVCQTFIRFPGPERLGEAGRQLAERSFGPLEA